ncbi:DUF3817 domain-containing protein [Melghirimyces algeriensis]|uniref:Integral membrane protein n=1 Tax=Melghirimyces algeriensis TaxID=910412 RepID=A0A521DJK5_9BACL|nr:DUF3817 domain-containing protein [Melghirimyces algeriensis]SMO71762.1 integral membrane protein [Melghirimyces algeriensis]
MFHTSLGRFRIVSFLEGLSYLLLLGIAMPLKYFADLPIAVTITGAIHGLLFVLYLILLYPVTNQHQWSYKQILGALIASVTPFGFIILDKKLLRHQEISSKQVTN